MGKTTQDGKTSLFQRGQKQNKNIKTRRGGSYREKQRKNPGKYTSKGKPAATTRGPGKLTLCPNTKRKGKTRHTKINADLDNSSLQTKTRVSQWTPNNYVIAVRRQVFEAMEKTRGLNDSSKRDRGARFIWVQFDSQGRQGSSFEAPTRSKHNCSPVKKTRAPNIEERVEKITIFRQKKRGGQPTRSGYTIQ